LDVHARESTIAVFDQGTGELTTSRVVGRPHELLERLMDISVPARMVYEAGPTGYGLARRARARGIEMLVCAPGRTDRAPTDRVKTDKRDAIRLARRLAAGELRFVTVPSVEHERLRDLVRCRDDIRSDLMRARHRLGKFLLRREIYYDAPGERWGRKHRIWLASLRFSDHASRLTMVDYLHAHDVLLARRDRIEAELEELASSSIFAQRSRGCAVCVASAPCPRWGSAPRSDGLTASSTPTAWPPT
jgi:transposase